MFKLLWQRDMNKLLLLRNACHKDIINLQVEMIRQFYIQLVRPIRPSFPLMVRCDFLVFYGSVFVFQTEIHCLIEKYSVNDSLVEEIERLKEENRRLRANY